MLSLNPYDEVCTKYFDIKMFYKNFYFISKNN